VSAVVTPPSGIPADSVRRAVEAVFARPEYEWAPTARPLHWLRESWNRFVDWLSRLDTQHPFVYRVLFWVAVVVLIVLLAHLALTAWRIYRSTVQPPGTSVPRVGRIGGTAEAHLARAESLAREGRYTEALAYRFLALLLELDQIHVLSFHPAKTPAEYVQEARLGADGRASFAGVVARLYNHVFGAAPCDAQEYRDFGAAAGSVAHHAASR
jgi:Domain of unknown function (DUF4129)